LLGCCFGGYFCYSICLCGIFEFTFFFALVCWFTSFLLFIRSEKFSIYISKSGDSFLKTLIIFLIEVVREFSRPIALTVRLTVNILVGHIISLVFYILFESVIGNFFSFLILFAIFIECFVFFIQSYIFSRLIFLYLNE
jgi:F0F1-type ATP synthase membrane subunit a